MSRELLGGSELNRISGSNERMPGFRVFVWNPNRVKINDVADGSVSDAPFELTGFCKRVTISHNSGFENGDDPSFPVADFSFNRNPDLGIFKKGWIADGVIVVVTQGDKRVRASDWPRVFTGTFRGTASNDTGTPARLSEGFTAHAHGREADFIEAPPITSDVFGPGIDVGVAAVAIAQKQMGLRQNEIRFGELGYPMRALKNQLIDVAPLNGLWQLAFPAGRKPRFDSWGRLCMIDVDLDKPATRIYADDALIAALVASPNDVEVNNRVVLTGQNANMTKAPSAVQRLEVYHGTTGFFESSLKKDLFYSEDRSQRAEGTFLVPIKRVRWGDADWTPKDEFHGTLELDTHYLRNVRATIFGLYLAFQLSLAAIDLAIQLGGQEVATAPVPSPTGGFTTMAVLRATLQVSSQVALAALLWSMNFIGAFEYEVWGTPFDFVYQQIVADVQLLGLEKSDLRTQALRNDLLSSMDDLKARARELLRRELVKDDVYAIDILDDLVLEIDDVIERANGDRFYITSTTKTLEAGADPILSLTAWKIGARVLQGAGVVNKGAEEILGYGFGYGSHYGEEY